MTNFKVVTALGSNRLTLYISPATLASDSSTQHIRENHSASKFASDRLRFELTTGRRIGQLE